MAEAEYRQQQHNNPNHTLDQRRQDRDQGQSHQQSSEIMSALGAIWQPIFSFNALLMRGTAEGLETIASELGGAGKQQRTNQ